VDLNICLNINHTWVGDIVVILEHVDTGTVAAMLDVNPDCSGNNIRVLLDDEASQFADDQCSGSGPAINGTFRPTDPLSTFDGELIDGTWVLYIYDFAAGDTGEVLGGFFYAQVVN
jgi:hypothetical protein